MKHHLSNWHNTCNSYALDTPPKYSYGSDGNTYRAQLKTKFKIHILHELSTKTRKKWNHSKLILSTCFITLQVTPLFNLFNRMGYKRNEESEKKFVISIMYRIQLLRYYYQ